MTRAGPERAVEGFCATTMAAEERARPLPAADKPAGPSRSWWWRRGGRGSGRHKGWPWRWVWRDLLTKASVGEHPKADGRPDNIHEEEDERDARLRLGRGEGDMVRRHEGIDAPEAL